jgi:hypothetical protein
VKTALALLASASALILVSASAALAQPASRQIHTTSDPVRAGKRFWVSLGGTTTLRLGQLKGFQVRGGWQFTRLLAFDLRVTTASSTYKGISVLPDYGTTDTDYASFNDTASEINRPRGETDSWSLLLIEPGISVHSHLFVDRMPNLSARARFGVARGMLKDKTNGASFTGYFPRFEGALQHRLGTGSPWSVEAALTLTSGHAESTEMGGNEGLLPLSWASTALSLIYWF